MKIEIFNDKAEKEPKSHIEVEKELKWAIGKVDWTICNIHQLRMIKDLLESFPTFPD